MSNDKGLDTLLELDGEIFMLDDGYWTKFEVHLVEETEQIPHGIRYSLTLHGKHNARILGYDNAHSIKPKRKKYGAKKHRWDHKHERARVQNYEFQDAGQLLSDFWEDVNKIMEEL